MPRFSQLTEGSLQTAMALGSDADAAVSALPLLIQLPEHREWLPILDRWQWEWAGGQLRIVGTVHRHSVLAGGTHWRTTPIKARSNLMGYVASVDQSVFRLGWPRHSHTGKLRSWPPALHVAACESWDEAVLRAMWLTGEHTVSATERLSIRSAFRGGKDCRRGAAEQVVLALRKSARDEVANVWTMLATNLADKDGRNIAADMMEAAVNDVENAMETVTAAEIRACKGWRMLANVPTRTVQALRDFNVDIDDSIACAHKVALLSAV